MTTLLTLKDNLQFQDTRLEIYDMDGQPWIQSSDLSTALGYQHEDGVRRIYERHQDEFLGDMSETVKLTVSGNLKKTVRVFSPDGCYLIAMLSQTKKAKEFRKWVLQVLKKYGKEAAQPSPLAIQGTVYAKTLLEDGTEGNPATTKQVGRVLGELSKLTKILDDLDGHLSLMNCGMQSMNETLNRVDEKIRVYAVDSDTIASMDWVFSNSLDTLMKHKSYKDGTIQRLKDENASLKKSIALVVANQNRAE
jgi:prophage antirepressor-like protein